jgi:hypothetical protein
VNFIDNFLRIKSYESIEPHWIYCPVNIFILNCSDFRQNSILPGLESINQRDLMENVEYFASEHLDGRLSGSPGYFKAAEYAREKFKTLGLKPAFSGILLSAAFR